RLPQLLGDGEHVDLAALLVEPQHRAVDGRVLLAIELIGLETLVDDEAVERRVGEQDRAEHRLLGLEVVRGEEGGAVLLLDRGHERPSLGRTPAPAPAASAGGARDAADCGVFACERWAENDDAPRRPRRVRRGEAGRRWPVGGGATCA